MFFVFFVVKIRIAERKHQAALFRGQVSETFRRIHFVVFMYFVVKKRENQAALFRGQVSETFRRCMFRGFRVFRG